MNPGIKNISAMLVAFLLSSASLLAQGYEISVNVKDFKGDTCYLGYQLADKGYLEDTVLVKNGQMVFKGKEELTGGIYLVIIPPENKFFQVLISKGEQKFSMETTGPDYVENMKIKGSKDNQAFYDYMHFLSEQNKKATPLRAMAESKKAAGAKEDDPENKKIKEDLDALDKEVKDYQLNVCKTLPKSLTAAIIKANMTIDIPKAPKKADGKDDEEFAYRFYKKHFFDDFDFGDDRYVRTPFLDQKIMQYVEKLTIPNPDSLNEACDYILEMSRKNKEVYKYCASKLLNHFASSKIICMDAVYVHIADKYYCDPNGPYGGGFWVEKEQLAKICDNSARLRGVRCGFLAPNLVLNKLDGTQVSLYDVKAEYVAVYFWDPDCGNCKKMSARFVSMYDSLQTMGVQIFGICSKDYKEYDKCNKKVEEMGMKWINTGDPYFQARAKQLYDIQMTPFVYLLDKDKKIIYKHIDPDQLKDIVAKDIEKKKKDKG